MIDKELLRKLLKPYTNGIDSGEIYAHGYPESRLIPKDINKKIEKKVIESLNNPKAFVGYLGITKSGSVTLSTRKTVRYNRRTE